MAKLIGVLQRLLEALNAYLADPIESGRDNYNLDELVPIPIVEPTGCEPNDAEWIAWEVKVAVVALQDEYAQRGGGDIVAEEGQVHWKEFIAHSREHASGANIYNAGVRFRAWAKRSIETIKAPVAAVKWRQRAGRKRQYDAKVDQDIANQWIRARDSGVKMRQFAEDIGKTPIEVRRTLNRVRGRKYRTEG